jgi:hypothetical protein
MYLEIEVDGKLLAHHFVGRLGAHPSQLSPIGWRRELAGEKDPSVRQLLGLEPSKLESGRIPVLVCEECGDVCCGAFAVRVSFESDRVRWTDWAHENCYEPAQSVEWPTKPDEFVFDRRVYENELRKVR